MKELLKQLTKLYRLYCFYISPSRLVMRNTVKDFFSQQEACLQVLEVGGGNSIMKNIVTTVTRCEKFISSDIAPSENTDVVCDAQDMPFPNDEFNLVVAFEVMEHIPDTKLFLAEANRVLKKDGYVTISIPFIFGKHDHQDFYRWTTQGLEKVFQEQGLKILVLNKRGGTFLAITSLVTNYIQQVFAPSDNGWRAQGLAKKLYFGIMSIFLLPLDILSWIAFLLDSIIDRNSANSSGFILIAQKT